jgi:hypothetical protein
MLFQANMLKKLLVGVDYWTRNSQIRSRLLQSLESTRQTDTLAAV